MDSKLHQKHFVPDAVGPLTGVRVIDLSRLVAGNMVTHALSDFGADVIKIEKPEGGDDLRNWKVKGIGTYWKIYGRNKKSLTLQFRSEEGRDILARLLRSAQVVVENFVPGYLEKYGLGPEWMHSVSDKLVILRVSGWGQTGPFSHKPGFGSLTEAMSGYAALTGFSDGPPILPPMPLADMVAGVYGALAVTMALRHIEVGRGGGQVIDLSLFEPLLSVLGPSGADYKLTGQVPERVGSRSPIMAPRNVYRCGDGKFVALSAAMQSMTEKLFQAIGRSELITDPRFATNAARVSNVDTLDDIIAAFMADRTLEEALELFDAAGVTVGPVCTIADLLEHPFVREREVLISLPDSDMGEVPMHNVVPRLSASPGAIRSPAPRLGEHNAEILEALGLSAESQGLLKANGVI